MDIDHDTPYQVRRGPDDRWHIYDPRRDISVGASPTYEAAQSVLRTIAGRRYDFVASQKNVKRHQRTLEFWEQLKRAIAPFNVIGTRGAFYQAESAGLVPKDDAGYDKVQRALVEMRRDGELPYEKIQDTGRVRRRVWAAAVLGDAADTIESEFRYDYWEDQPTWLEVWAEKDALTPQIQPICEEFGVYFAALRGFESESFIYEAAKQLRAVRKPITILYLGDHDPGGWWIARTLQSDFLRFGVQVTVRHLAVLPWQIEAWQLRTRDAKKKDTRYQSFIEEFGSDQCVEVDAIPPNMLQLLVRIAVEAEIDWPAWERAQRVEQAMKETNDSVYRIWRQMTPGETVALRRAA